MCSTLAANTSRACKFPGLRPVGNVDAWRLRLTAFALLPLTFAFVVIVVSLVGRDYASARALLGSPCPAILMVLFLGFGAWHMAIGMQAVIEDYVHSEHAESLGADGQFQFQRSDRRRLDLCRAAPELHLSFPPGARS